MQGEWAGCSRNPQEPKRSTWWDRKRFKMIQNNVVMLGLTVLMHFQQVWGPQISKFFEVACPRRLLKLLCFRNLQSLSCKLYRLFGPGSWGIHSPGYGPAISELADQSHPLISVNKTYVTDGGKENVYDCEREKHFCKVLYVKLNLHVASR